MLNELIKNGPRALEIWKTIDFVRSRTLALLADIPPDSWYSTPSGVTTHIAWQVGHIAMAEYRIGLHMQRGVQHGDDAIISQELLSLCGRGSSPSTDAVQYGNPGELLETCGRVHAAVREQVLRSSDQALLAAPERAHPLGFQTKGEVLGWLPLHEMTHYGQIALLRRMLGLTFIW